MPALIGQVRIGHLEETWIRRDKWASVRDLGMRVGSDIACWRSVSSGG